MRSRVRFHTATATATAAVAAVVLLAGCGSGPREELEDWWSSGGEGRVKGLSDTSGRVNEVYGRPLDAYGPACQDLLTETAKARKLGAPPSENAQGFWKEALTAFEHGGGECVAGAGSNDQPRAGEGIREVQKGLSRLAAAVSLIRGDLQAR
ncbi:hypothetical protein ACFYYS_19290 [Streptomyces sp. NPDC002120]|uniref:hypothetical protein n=1 Tax=Streptomyces sp. NPDC002120 TaxID=3364631 RepID=UPI0036B24485